MMSTQDLLLFVLNNSKTSYGVLETDIESLYKKVQLEINDMVHSNRGGIEPNMPDVMSELKELEHKGYVEDTKGKIGDNQYIFGKKTCDIGSRMAYEKAGDLKVLIGDAGVGEIIDLIKEQTAYQGKILTIRH